MLRSNVALTEVHLRALRNEAIAEEDQAMSVNDDVPCVWDKIQVKYRVEKGELVWWPATVLSSREYEAPGVVAGTGTVEFATYRNTRKTIEDVTFLADRTVATSGGETPWRSSAEAADAGAGNESEADWNPRARARAARALRGSSPEARVEYRIRIGDEDDSTRKDDGEEDVDDAEETDDKEIEEPPSQRRRIDCMSVSPSTRSPARDSGGPTIRHVTGRRASGSRAASLTGSAVDVLTQRLDVLEEKQNEVRKCAHREAYDEFVQDKKSLWKTRVLKLLSKNMKKYTPTAGRPFSAVLRSDKISFKEDMSYRYFQLLVEDMCKKGNAEDPPRGIRFVPSLHELRHPEADIKEGHVVFQSARAWLNWLGITSKGDLRKNMTKTSKQRDGATVTRVLGGLQWTAGDMTKPLRVFVGRSCVGSSTGDEANRGEEVPVVEFPNARWDSSNNTLATAPIAKRCCVGDYIEESDWNSVFTLSWRWTGGYDGRAVSAHGKKSGNVREGSITLDMPVVSFRGIETCSKVGEILTDKYLDSCT